MATISETTEFLFTGSSSESLFKHESTERFRCLLVMNFVRVDVDDDVDTDEDGMFVQLTFC